MYLKSIEIQGFKSFANKTVFEFKEGITGIVGPNGSGKSNIADAVRWVLGEQKIKQLRGSKMEDVIFSGTEIRKPLGFAYVAITINNADRALNIEYEEVTVSRRLYRSGESEYMMNGTECRLKDIYELFYDTGIGKEGYSIIGQGQIDKIIGGRPEDRRELFDEAAGIVKFKKRKVETLRKLEQERDNLARVNDIMSELERRIRPLERQSETAKKYLELKDRLKTYDINSFLLEIGELNDTLLKIDEKSKIVTNDFEDRNKELEESKLKYEELDKLLEELDFSIENIRENYNNSVREKDRLEGDLRLLDEQINSAKAQDENIKGKIKEIEKNILENNAEQETYEKEKELIKAQLEQASKEGADADSKVSAINERIAEIKADIEEVKTKIIDNLNEKSNVNSRMSRFDAMIEQINIRKQTIAESLEKFESDTSEQSKIIEKIETELKAVNDEIVTLSEKNDNTQKRILELSALKKELFKKNDGLNDKFHSINSNINFLNNMTERYEGYGNSIKKVMELKETKKGIVGVVADIISSDKKYEVAIETALGGNIQNVVTDNENTAKEAIEYLKRGKFGRATFLPLSSIANKTGFTNERALMESGVIGLACDLVKIDKQYENIARFLLGRVLVVDTIDNALVIARKYNYTLRIVTLEGETLNPGGSLSGGAFKNQSNLLGRRRELNELKESLDEIKKEMALVEQSIVENDKESKNLKDLLDANKVTLSEKFILQNTLKMQHNQANSKNIEISENYQNFTKENAEIMEQIASIDTDRKEMLDRVNSCERVNSELEAQVDSLNVMLDKETEKQSEELKQNEELRLTLQSLNQKNDYAVANLNRIYADTKRLKEELENIKSNALRSVDDINERNEKIASIKNLIKEAEINISSFKEKLEEATKNKEEQTKDHKDFFTKREELTENINNLDKEIIRLQAAKEKYDELKEKQVNYMWDEYQITYSDAEKLKNDEFNSLSELKKNITSVKNEIKDLGEVNVNAIDEYKEVSERYSFLKTQHDDLVVAEDNLIKIIKELEDGMKKQFSEKFEDIKAQFDIVFQKLFGGGRGALELSIEEDVDMLECDIQIIAQPPGKNLKNMMQLSGGEKALTAIALLFAIQNLKPSPFCLLDEIEAALDDSNVNRFAGYLHNLTEHTQFIVITHRRGTMNASDRLYGITMQEKGVSTLVSVNLIEAQLEAEEKKKRA